MPDTIVSEGALAQADLLSTYLREVGRTPCLTRVEEKALLERIGRGDRAARNELVSANLRLVVSVSRRYQGRGLPLAELIAEGNLGLMRAARGSVSAPGRFAEYAEWWIRASVARALEEQTRFHTPPELANRYEEIR
jgi:DNA-directed RNA polymerase sigma subunit (sigma70/sigma32)